MSIGPPGSFLPRPYSDHSPSKCPYPVILPSKYCSYAYVRSVYCFRFNLVLYQTSYSPVRTFSFGCPSRPNVTQPLSAFDPCLKIRHCLNQCFADSGVNSDEYHCRAARISGSRLSSYSFSISITSACLFIRVLHQASTMRPSYPNSTFAGKSRESRSNNIS